MAAQILFQKDALIQRVKNIIRQSILEDENLSFEMPKLLEASFGKMLRTSLASGLLGDRSRDWAHGIDYVCAAVELIHTASLFHDDVIDGATLRRGKPTLWKMFSPNGAILIGDIIYCKSLMLLIDSPGAAYLKLFTQKVHEVCLAEARQELLVRGSACDTATSLQIARGKTGPLFAVIARACGGDDAQLASSLEEVGYRIGTAYQLADDLIDEMGDGPAAGKTLGTDRLRKKYTFAHQGDSARDFIADTMTDLCESSLDLLSRWPDKREGLRRYLDKILFPSCEVALQGNPVVETVPSEFSVSVACGSGSN
ncbi:MAG: polyprenyl synthetase family protein [Chitinivibrionales bacterium]|nr:polyprenyl synthetase family protein [Chitinivibrionales bacterium]